MTSGTRVLGVDFGTRRVGLAITDDDRRLALPLATYQRRRQEWDAAYFRQLAADEGFAQIVVGLPIHTTGREGRKAAEARAFGAWLGQITGKPVVFWDERFSTAQAQELLRETGARASQRKKKLDRVAAQIILQSYLEAGCPAEEPPRPLES